MAHGEVNVYLHALHFVIFYYNSITDVAALSVIESTCIIWSFLLWIDKKKTCHVILVTDVSVIALEVSLILRLKMINFLTLFYR